jgi:hypothetical protein
MAKLYPPNINGTIPAFYSDTINGTTTMVVPFSMNKAVGFKEIEGIEVKIKSLNGTLIGVCPSSYIKHTYNDWPSYTEKVYGHKSFTDALMTFAKFIEKNR